MLELRAEKETVKPLAGAGDLALTFSDEGDCDRFADLGRQSHSCAAVPHGDFQVSVAADQGQQALSGGTGCWGAGIAVKGLAEAPNALALDGHNHLVSLGQQPLRDVGNQITEVVLVDDLASDDLPFVNRFSRR